MRTRLNPRTARRIRYLPLLVGLLLVISGLLRAGASNALEIDTLVTGRDVDAPADSSRLMVDNPDLWHEGPTLVVSNTTMENNGECWRASACIEDPGPDGISLAEALQAVNSYNLELNAHETITFDPSLYGAVITTTDTLEIIQDGLTIDGDIDDDGVPDVTLESRGPAEAIGFALRGVSHVIIDGLHFRDFGAVVGGGVADGGAIGISNDVEHDVHHLENLVIRNCTFTNSGESAIDVSLQDHAFASIRNLEIVGNTFDGYWMGITVNAGKSSGTSDNEISHVKIISNTLISDGNLAGIALAGSAMAENSSRNLIEDVEIRGNTMTGHPDITILVVAANYPSCNDNVIRNVVIAENAMNGTPMVIELVPAGENGTDISGNVVTDVKIVDNVLTGGGIQLSGAQAAGATGNTISNVLAERNQVTDCANAGFYLHAGDDETWWDDVGPYHNLVEDIVIRNNLVANCADPGIQLAGLAYPRSLGNTINDVTIANNTLVGNAIRGTWEGGININNEYEENVISGVTISNTILWGNNPSDTIGGTFDLSEVSVVTSILSDTRFTGGDGNIYGDPQFAAPGSGDYRLQPGSPAIESGDPSGAGVGPEDLDGKLRLWDYDGNESAIVDRGAYEYGSTETEEIEVRGNGIEILDGDVVPVPWDGTDFGSAIVGVETVTRTFAIRNTGGTTLTLTGTPKVAITGTHASDFAVTAESSSPIVPGGETSFTVTFDPIGKGLREATIRIDNDDTDEDPYTLAVQGIGTEPEIGVYGNDTLIVDGDTTPSVTDSTDFGTVEITDQHAGRMFVIENTGTTSLTLTGDPPVAITGPHAADFAVTAQPSTTIGTREAGWPGFEVTFKPGAAGLRSAVVSIENNDADENPYTFAIQGTGKWVPTVGFISHTMRIAEGAGWVTIPVTLSAPSTETVTVGYRTAPDEWTTASEGGDYVHTEGMLTFEPGETVATFEVEIVDDPVYEGPELLRLQLDNGTNAYVGPSGANLHIDDDDPQPTVAFSAPSYSVSENEATAPITVTLQGRSAVTATVDVRTDGGTATPEVDYGTVERTLVFTPGVTSQTFAVSIVEDGEEEENETVELTLGRIEEAQAGAQDRAVLTIVGERQTIYLPLALRG